MVKADLADISYQPPSKQELAGLRGELITMRANQKIGSRATNLGAAQDFRRGVELLNIEVINMLFYCAFTPY